MSELLLTRHQLAKVREMRQELRRIEGTLSQLESTLGSDILHLERNTHFTGAAGVASFNLVDGPLTGWLHSMIESYMAIVFTQSVGYARLKAAQLGTFVQDQREREEAVVRREQAKSQSQRP